MARESQGLQVLLIVFVMLSVVLGVSLYLYIKKADEEHKAALAAASSERAAKDATAKQKEECDDLKSLIGFPPDKSTEDIKKQAKEDMETYGNAKKLNADGADSEAKLFDPNNLHYSRLLAGMFTTIQERTYALLDAKREVARLQLQFKDRDKAMGTAIAAVENDVKELGAGAKKIAADYTRGQERTTQETDDLVKKLEGIKKDATTKIDTAAAVAKSSQEAVKNKEEDVSKLVKELRQFDKGEMDVPSGEITWVSLQNKLVWINRGRADNLQRQTKFTVYSAESTLGAKAVKKGTVEVTRIDGDHMAQARILDDKLADPIMAGDKVFNPAWSPGQQNHFALTGIMNLDGDNRNQLSTVRGMITDSGGKVDCELDEQGRKQGEITPNTRYIVIGDEPAKNAPEAFKKNYKEILLEADRYQVRHVTLSTFKQQMNYQKSSSLERYGDVAPPSSPPRTGGSAPKAPKAPAKAAPAAPKSEDSGN